MRIGFVELLLILLIASLTIGPIAALWVDRWLRPRQPGQHRQLPTARALQEAQRAAERRKIRRLRKIDIGVVLA